ncbi:MAG: substrate-binding domain-containing protein [Clostridiales bacterium]|nr:substrate-binding domain-containing protein [Clostridiales bacterium]
MKMRKILATVLAAALIVTALAGCQASNPAGFNADSAISVVTREDGSGTRSAFIELAGILNKNEAGETVDMTTEEAITADATDIMMTNIANDPYAIGYISLGSLNETVKALDIDGVAASADNVKDGSYVIQRPFNIAYKEGVSAVARDFVAFIMSAEGQAIAAANGYIAIDEEAAAFNGGNEAGTVVIAGSSSVTPLMEKLQEAYLEINADAAIELNMSDSSAGMNSAIEGTCDIGMASRALKETETAELTGVTIAMDGIAVIVNNSNTTDGLSLEDVKNVFTGAVDVWSAVQ